MDFKRYEATIGIEVAKVAMFVRLGAELSDGACDSTTDDLGGACANASHELARILRCMGYEAEFVEGEYFERPRGKDKFGMSHCWVELDGYIIDITATQFGVSSPVHVVPASSRYYRANSRGKKAEKVVIEDWLVDNNDWMSRSRKRRLKYEIQGLSSY